MDKFGPYDPTVDYDGSPAIKELMPDHAPTVSWKPLNMTRRNFLRGVVCSGVVIAGSAYVFAHPTSCLLYTSPSPRDATLSRMPSSA